MTRSRRHRRPRRLGTKAVKAVAITYNVVLSVALLLSAYGGMIAPHRSTLPALAAMVFPFVILLMVASLAVNIFLFKRLAIANAVVTIACIPAMLTYSPLNFSHATFDKDDGDTFTFLSYNAAGYRDCFSSATTDSAYNATLGYIISTDADIVCLQEALKFSRLREEDLYEAQLDTLTSRYPYRTINDTGLMLMSKFPFDTVAINKSSIKADVTCDYACYRVDCDRRPIYIFNVHLQSIGLNKDDKELYRELTSANINKREIKQARTMLISKLSAAYRAREYQAESLRHNIDSITAKGGTVIVAGDFNDIPGSYSVRTVRGDDMRCAWTDAGFGPAITYHANRFYFRIDHILYRGDLEVIDISRDKQGLSDHYPLLATFRRLY